MRPSVERVLNRDQRSVRPRWFESNALEGAARSRLSRRYRSDKSGLSFARLGLGAGAVADPVPTCLADLEADPARYGRLCLRRLRYFVFFDETNPKSRVLAYRVPHLGLTIFALVGVVLAVPPSDESHADDGHGRADRPLPCADDRVGAVSHPDRAALSIWGLPECRGCADALGVA